jgi:hypothetical protein
VRPRLTILNLPAMYVANLPLRADQLACGVNDLLSQSYAGDVGPTKT